MKQLLILLIVAFCWTTCRAQTKQAVTISFDGVLGFGEWKEFVSDEGRFSVLMPGAPVATINERDTGDGKIIFHSFAVKLPEAFYQVGYSDFPVSSDDRLVASVRNLLATQKGAEILSERQTTMANFQASEWWLVQNGAAFGIRRVFVVHGRLYQINMLVPLERAFKKGRASLKTDDQTELFTLASSRFFNSFKLTGAAETLGEVDRMLRNLKTQHKGVVTMVGSAADPSDPNLIRAGVINGRAVHLVTPAYPAIARSAHASGQVSVQVLIDVDGNVAAAQVVDGHPLLRVAAIKAARESKFTPTLLEGKPVMVNGIIIYNFVAQ